MAEESLQEFARGILEGAQKIVRQGKTLTPFLFMDGGDGTVAAAFPEYGNPDLKFFLREAMKSMLREKGAERYCFVIEAWFGAPKTPREEGYRPSKDPDRMEAIAVTAATKSGEKLLLVCEIKRGEGKLVQFKEFQPDISFGALSDLFETDTRQ